MYRACQTSINPTGLIRTAIESGILSTITWMDFNNRGRLMALLARRWSDVGRRERVREYASAMVTRFLSSPSAERHRPDTGDAMIIATLGKRLSRLAEKWVPDPFVLAVGLTTIVFICCG